MQSEQPKQAGGGRLERVVRPGEDRAHPAGRVAGVERVKPPAGILEVGGDGRQPGLPRVGRGDREREGQPRSARRIPPRAASAGYGW
jgi:hypothetical protein